MRPPEFSLYRGYENLLAEHIYMRILGHAGRILKGFVAQKTKNFLWVQTRTSQDLIYEMQNNEQEISDLRTLVDRASEMFRWTWSP
jgi:hypothetical protein